MDVKRYKRNQSFTYVKCPVCAMPANGGGCKGCGRWYCKEHIYRHPNCEEGR